MHPFPNSQISGGGYQTLVWNPSDKDPDVVLSNNDRTMSFSYLASGAVRSVTSRVTGKWYFEVAVEVVTPPGIAVIGIATGGVDIQSPPGFDPFSWGYRSGGAVFNNGGPIASYASFTAGDVISVAFDKGSSSLWFGKNGVWQAGNPATGTGGIGTGTAPYFAMIYGDAAAPSAKLTALSLLSYAPPAGFLAL